MFYDTSSFRLPLEGTRDDRSHGLVVLTPSESKRLIAKGALQLPEVRRALEEGLVIVSRGTSTGFVAEELAGSTLRKEYGTVGIITHGRLANTVPEGAVGPWVFRRGKLVDEPAEEVLKEFTATDVSFKGANAIDPRQYGRSGPRRRGRHHRLNLGNPQCPWRPPGVACGSGKAHTFCD